MYLKFTNHVFTTHTLSKQFDSFPVCMQTIIARNILLTHAHISWVFPSAAREIRICKHTQSLWADRRASLLANNPESSDATALCRSFYEGYSHILYAVCMFETMSAREPPCCTASSGQQQHVPFSLIFNTLLSQRAQIPQRNAQDKHYINYTLIILRGNPAISFY